jgi:hypothetical protein
MTNAGQGRQRGPFLSLTSVRGLIALIAAFYSGLWFFSYANGDGQGHLAMANLMMAMAIALAPGVISSRIATMLVFALFAANIYVFVAIKSQGAILAAAIITLVVEFGTILIRRSDERHRALQL